MKNKYYLADTKTIRKIKQFNLDILYNHVYRELQKKIKETVRLCKEKRHVLILSPTTGKDPSFGKYNII